jgi:hypothetical protein
VALGSDGAIGHDQSQFAVDEPLLGDEVASLDALRASSSSLRGAQETELVGALQEADRGASAEVENELSSRRGFFVSSKILHLVISDDYSWYSTNWLLAQPLEGRRP